MRKKTTTKTVSTGIVLGKSKKSKNTCPTYVKWIAGIVLALLVGATGFFGGIFGLDAEKQDKIKQIITNTSSYQETNSEIKTEIKK